MTIALSSKLNSYLDDYTIQETGFSILRIDCLQMFSEPFVRKCLMFNDSRKEHSLAEQSRINKIPFEGVALLPECSLVHLPMHTDKVPVCVCVCV